MPLVRSRSVSSAWLEALNYALVGRDCEVEDLVVTVDGLESGITEDSTVRELLDRSLVDAGLQQVHTVASTIFPSSLWRAGMSRRELYTRYERIWPRLSKYSKNRRGTYFQRLIGYPKFSHTQFNQLDQVISTLLGGNHRRSALQASLIVPSTDLNDARQQGFPCMQQIAFVPSGNRLRLSAYYPMQYMYERAYGNYIGLIELGRFTAEHMGLTLSSVTCIAVVAKADNSSSARAFCSALTETSSEVRGAV